MVFRRYVLLWLLCLSFSPCAGLAAATPGARFEIPDDMDALFEPKWRRCFVRRLPEAVLFGRQGIPLHCAEQLTEGAEFLDGRYLLNQADALRFFYGWYLSHSELDFVGMLGMQHRLACLGIDGKRKYVSLSPSGSLYVSDMAFPGLFREELEARDAHPIDSDYWVLSDAEWKELYALGASELPFVSVSPQGRVGLHPAKWKPMIEGIPEGFLVENRLMEDLQAGLRIFRTAPRERALKAYRKLAARRMEKLKAYRELTHEQALEQLASLLEDLADYYHVAIHWMPFSSVNNSLLMGEVNAILLHLGFQPLLHGRLDYQALAVSGAVFRRVFKGAFFAVNSRDKN